MRPNGDRINLDPQCLTIDPRLVYPISGEPLLSGRRRLNSSIHILIIPIPIVRRLRGITLVTRRKEMADSGQYRLLLRKIKMSGEKKNEC